MALEGCLANSTWTSIIGFATSFSIYRRAATVNYFRTNFSIISIDNLSAPEPVYLSIPGLLTAFNAQFQEQGIGSLLSNSIGAMIAYTQPTSGIARTERFAVSYLRNLLVLPLHYFQENYSETGMWLNFTKPHPGLPSDMYTTVSIAAPSYHAVPGRASLLAFAVLNGVILLLCLVTFFLVAIKTTDLPRRTGHPTLDFAINCLNTREESSLGDTMASLEGYDEQVIKQELQGRRIKCRWVSRQP
jgi:hypothetical protein